MDSNIMNKEPEYSKKEIEEMQRLIIECDHPYTEQDVLNCDYDGKCDVDRMGAYMAIKTLTRLGIPIPEK